MKFTILSLGDDILPRLFASGHDNEYFERMAELYNPRDAKLRVMNYRKARRSERERMITELSENCTTLPLFKGLNRDQVELDVLLNLSIPSTHFRKIFGHVGIERELYNDVRRFLKREFEGSEVVATYDKRSRVGIRYADFTVVKKKVLNRFDVFSFDVKVTPAAFESFLNQAHDFLAFSNNANLVATPGLVLEAGRRWGRPIDSQKSIENKLKRNGIGLYVVDATSGQIKRVLDPGDNDALNNDRKIKALNELGFRKL
jgi:hypothetical protein